MKVAVLVTTLLACCVACAKWSEPQDLRSTLGAKQPPDRVKLVLNDRQGIVESPRMVGDSIFGQTSDRLLARGYETGPCPDQSGGCVAVSIPTRDVAWIEIREPDGRKTGGWVLLSASTALLAVCLALC